MSLSTPLVDAADPGAREDALGALLLFFVAVPLLSPAGGVGGHTCLLFTAVGSSLAAGSGRGEDVVALSVCGGG